MELFLTIMIMLGAFALTIAVSQAILLTASLKCSALMLTMLERIQANELYDFFVMYYGSSIDYTLPECPDRFGTIQGVPYSLRDYLKYRNDTVDLIDAFNEWCVDNDYAQFTISSH